MRAFFVAAIVAATAGPVAAQSASQLPVRRSLTVEIDSAGFIKRATVEEIRRLHSEFEALMAQVRGAQEQLVRDAREGRDRRELMKAETEFARVITALFPKQSQLTLACATLRAVSNGREGYLGVTFGRSMQLTSPQAGLHVITSAGGPPRIDAVDLGSPADRAGVRPGDEWLAIAGKPVLEAADADLDVLLKPGARVVLKLRAEGKERETTVVVAKRPEYPEKECESSGGFAIAAPLPEMWGGRISVSPATPPARIAPRSGEVPRAGMGVFFESRVMVPLYGAVFRTLDDDAREVMKIDVEGVLVDQVGPTSPAGIAGLRRYDVVTHVNGTVVKSPANVLQISSDARTLTLTVVRSGETRTVTLKRP